MATRLKTVEYAFPTLTTLANNTLTSFTQITIYLPETIVAFKSVELRVTMDDAETSTTAVNYTTKTVDLRLGAASYTSTTNGQTITAAGENISILLVRDFNDHFVSNWSGTSMTCDARLQIAQSTAGQSNVAARLFITYEYDDTSSIHIKTVYIPLNGPATSLDTSTPASALDTIPALDTYLPEASKTYRDRFIWFGANTHNNNATSHNISFQIDTDTAEVSGVYSGAMTSSRWTEYIFKPTFTTNTTHEFRVWTSTGAVARHHNPQIYLVVTYEFDPESTSTVMNSVLLPMDWESPAGGTAATDWQRATRDLWIQEPGTITLQRLALLTDYEAPISLGTNVRLRIGTGSWIQHTTVAAVVCGQCGFYTRNDASFTLTKGKNVLQADVYSASANAFPTNLSSLWIVNYVSDQHTDGVGAHNHSVYYNIVTHGTGAAVVRTLSALKPFISVPEANYFLNAAGMVFEWMSNTNVNPAGVIVQAEKLVAEGGLEWYSIYTDSNSADPEVGRHTNYAQARRLFKRWTGDSDADRLNIETPRRFRTIINTTALTAASAWHKRLTALVTYHTITYTISGTISGSAGGSITIDIHRAETGEKILSTSHTGDGAYSLTWYDDTADLYAVAYEDSTHTGRSDDSAAS